MRRNSTFWRILEILVTGMGNVKLGDWRGSLIYFASILLIGIGLVYLEQRFIEPIYHPTQTVRTFALLVYITFAFFWNGSGFFHRAD